MYSTHEIPNLQSKEIILEIHYSFFHHYIHFTFQHVVAWWKFRLRVSVVCKLYLSRVNFGWNLTTEIGE